MDDRRRVSLLGLGDGLEALALVASIAARRSRPLTDEERERRREQEEAAARRRAAEILEARLRGELETALREERRGLTKYRRRSKAERRAGRAR